MISREEAYWLYRCVLGREPESDSSLEWCVAHDVNFEAARRRFLSSDEFYRQKGRAVVALPAGRATSRRERILSSMQVCDHLPSDDKDQGLIAFGTIDPMLRALKSRLRVQVAVVVGGRSEMEVAIGILEVCGVSPMILIKCCSPSVPDQFDDWLASRQGRLPHELTIVEKRVSGNELIEQLETAGVDIELAVIGQDLGDSVIHRYFSRLGFVGLVMCNVATKREEWLKILRPTAELHHLDIVEFCNYALLQKTVWVTPLHYNGIRTRLKPVDCQLHMLAIAAIVKNEADNIETMLRSCAQIASFVAILDTGSTDDTCKIAEDVLIEIGVPFKIAHSQFVNFASSRNQALDLVPEDYTWTLMLDADEHLVPEDHEKWMALLVNEEIDAWSIPRYNFNDPAKLDEPTPYPDRQRRLFRNKRENPIRYGGRVHETPVGVQAWGFAPANLTFFGGQSGGPHIHHMGQVHLSQERWEEKNAFYSQLMHNAE